MSTKLLESGRELASLDNTQRFYSDCCLSLSAKTVQLISDALPKYPPQALVLSIGSGSGFLERHLQLTSLSVCIEGVEVNKTNVYLSEEHITVVKGTWDLTDRASDAACLLFVYPRSQTLISQYLKRFRDSPDLKKIIWIGPSVDWQDFSACFHNSGFEPRSDAVCLSESEKMIIVEKVQVL
jgi:hypothetical protein